MNHVMMIGRVVEIGTPTIGPKEIILNGRLKVPNQNIKRRKYSGELTWDFIVWGNNAKLFHRDVKVGDVVCILGDLRRVVYKGQLTKNIEISVSDYSVLRLGSSTVGGKELLNKERDDLLLDLSQQTNRVAESMKKFFDTVTKKISDVVTPNGNNGVGDGSDVTGDVKKEEDSAALNIIYEDGGGGGGKYNHTKNIHNDISANNPSYIKRKKSLYISYLDTYNLKEWGELRFSNPGDACFDLRTVEDAVIYPHQPRIVKTGIKTSFDSDCVLQIYPRSGLACKEGLTVANSPGIVDSGYRGEIMVGLLNNTMNPITIQRGDRIAQARLCNVVETRFVTVSIDSLGDSERGEGGFGSTGMS